MASILNPTDLNAKIRFTEAMFIWFEPWNEKLARMAADDPKELPDGPPHPRVFHRITRGIKPIYRTFCPLPGIAILSQPGKKEKKAVDKKLTGI
jgi:hypothetical protein